MEPAESTEMEGITMSNAGAGHSPESPTSSDTPEDGTSIIKTHLPASPAAPNPLIPSRMIHYPDCSPEMSDEERVIAWKGVMKGEKIVTLRYVVIRIIDSAGEEGTKRHIEVGGTPPVLLRVCRGGMAGGSKVLDLEHLMDGTPFGRLAFENSAHDDDQSGAVGDVVFMRYFDGQHDLDDDMRARRNLDDLMEANPTTTTTPDLVMAVLPDGIPDHFLESPIEPATVSNYNPAVKMIEISLNHTELLFKAAGVGDGYLPVNQNAPVTQNLSALLAESIKHAFHDLKSLKPEWEGPFIDVKEFVAAIGLEFSKDLYRLLTRPEDVEAAMQESGGVAKKRNFEERLSEKSPLVGDGKGGP